MFHCMIYVLGLEEYSSSGWLQRRWYRDDGYGTMGPATGKQVASGAPAKFVDCFRKHRAGLLGGQARREL